MQEHTFYDFPALVALKDSGWFPKNFNPIAFVKEARRWRKHLSNTDLEYHIHATIIESYLTTLKRKPDTDLNDPDQLRRFCQYVNINLRDAYMSEGISRTPELRMRPLESAFTNVASSYANPDDEQNDDGGDIPATEPDDPFFERLVAATMEKLRDNPTLLVEFSKKLFPAGSREELAWNCFILRHTNPNGTKLRSTTEIAQILGTTHTTVSALLKTFPPVLKEAFTMRGQRLFADVFGLSEEEVKEVWESRPM